MLVYLACIIGIGLPLLMAEVMLGRRGQENPADTMRLLAREARVSPWWQAVGFIGIFGALFILSFYSVVAGWILDYTVLAARGFGQFAKEDFGPLFAGLLANPVKLIGWHSAFMLLNFVVVAGGITGGIERANKILMPALFAILLILLGYGMVAADLPAAFRFMFHFEPAAISAKVILAAMGHAFFTLSLGMGAIMTYGSYLGRETPIGRTCLYIGAADTAIALLAGLSIFAIVFAQGLEPAAGPGLILQTLPIAFSQMPFGGVIGVLFFLLVVFAAWTSSISLIEPPSALLIERFGLRRPVAVGLVCLAAWLLGMAVALSFNDWGAYQAVRFEHLRPARHPDHQDHDAHRRPADRPVRRLAHAARPRRGRNRPVGRQLQTVVRRAALPVTGGDRAHLPERDRGDRLSLADRSDGLPDRPAAVPRVAVRTRPAASAPVPSGSSDRGLPSFRGRCIDRPRGRAGRLSGGRIGR